MLDQITPVILTFNEAPNIHRTLSALSWAKCVIVVDSFSQDDTQKICEGFNNVRFIQREFDQHAKQWNFAITQEIPTDWVLALDADHVVSDELITELDKTQPAFNTQGFWAEFIYKIDGQALHGSLYPPLISLYKKDQAHYIQDGHTQRVQVTGNLQKLSNKLYHDDRKSMQRWLNSQWFYAKQEADKLKSTPWGHLSTQDKIRKIPMLAPMVIIPYTLLVKKVIVSGRAGLLYTMQRVIAELILQYILLKRRK